MGEEIKRTMPNLRMDNFLGTVDHHSSELQALNLRLEATVARKADLQKALEEKRKHITALRAEVHDLRVKELEMEERERVQLNRIEKSNVALKDSNTTLDKTRDRETELLQLVVQKVSEFEVDSHCIAARFQALQLSKDESDESITIVTEADVSELQEEVDKLEAELKALAPPISDLPLDVLEDLIREVTIALENAKKLVRNLMEKEASLRKTVQQL